MFDKLATLALRLLPLAYFGMMALGQLLGSYFLWIDKLDGSQWVMLSLGLFSTNQFGHVLAERLKDDRPS